MNKTAIFILAIMLLSSTFSSKVKKSSLKSKFDIKTAHYRDLASNTVSLDKCSSVVLSEDYKHLIVKCSRSDFASVSIDISKRFKFEDGELELSKSGNFTSQCHDCRIIQNSTAPKFTLSCSCRNQEGEDVEASFPLENLVIVK